MSKLDLSVVECAAEDIKSDKFCSCTEPHMSLAYESSGVLKCARLDCAYFMHNFFDSFIDMYARLEENKL